jgi:hypothetical protein
MDDEHWSVKRRRELEAMAPVKRKRKVEPFVKVPLWWIAAAAKHTRTPGMLVCIELLHASWRAKSLTFPLPNGRLQRSNVNRETKRRVLRALEQGGLIKVERPPRKAPIVTLVSL